MSVRPITPAAIAAPVMLLLAAVPSLLALDPSLAISQYAKKHWQVEEGLPQNYVTWITQTREGYLLVATSGGVARFDGVRFSPIVLDAATGVTREWITSVEQASDGAVWIASRDAGLFVERGGRTEHAAAFRFDALLRRATPEARIAGLGTDGLKEWGEGASGAGLRAIASGFGPADPSWYGLAEMSDGSLLAATSQGLLRVRVNSKPLPLLRPGGPAGLALTVAPAPATRGFWVGTAKGLYRANGEGSVERNAVAGVPGPVTTVVEDRDGAVWAGTWGHGLYRVTGATRQVAAWTTRDGLPDDFVHALFEDREGNLWIGGRAGLSRWKSGPIVPHGLAEGLNGQFFSAVTGDAKGRLWLGSWRSGLYEVHGNSMGRIPLDRPDLNVLVRALAAGPDGRLWMSDWGGFARREGAGWRRYFATELGFGPQGVHALVFDRQGSLWLGSDAGLFRYPKGEPAPASRPVLRGPPVRALLADRRGRLWSGTTGGLWMTAGENPPREVTGLPHGHVTSLAEDAAGRIWATTRANGIALVSAGETRTLDQRHGLPPLPIYAVVDDGLGSLWLSSPQGIFELPAAQIDDLLAGRRQRLDVVAYHQDDGMRTIECQNVGQPSGWRDAAGDLWFPTVRGVVRIRPSMKKRLDAPHVLIEAVESGALGHTVRFTAPRLGSPSRIEFRYRMESGADWAPAGAERVLRFSALPAGEHRLLIAARETGSAWGPPAAVTLLQAPRWFETWWFRTLAAVALAVALALIYRWRVYLLKSRYAAVIAERNRIAREWHDTLLAGFSAISWQLDMTLKRWSEKPEQARETVEVARTMVQHYRAEARRVIWDLRHDGTEPHSLETSIRESLTHITRDRDIQPNIEVEGQPPTALPGDLAQNVLRICQEAVTNAIRHAAPTRIDVRLRFEPARLTAEVTDNGRGFEPAGLPPTGHFGLDIMRERARRFGGDLRIVSSSGGGTIVTAAIPYPHT